MSGFARPVIGALLLATTLGACIPSPDRPQRGYDPQDDRSYRQPRDDQQPYEPQGGRPYRDGPDRYDTQPIDRGVAALPAPPPAWQARPVTPDARTIDAGSYTVQPGDTLRQVGDRTGAGSEAIARANALPPPFTIRPGQRLEIPGGRYHLVRAGQTGIAIARAYGVDWSRIVTANDLVEPYTLRVGMRVLIPGGEPALPRNARPARPTASPRRVLTSTQAIAEPSHLTSGFAWPVRGRIVAHFGPGASGEKFNGVKIAVPLGTPILAAADGVVAYAGSGVPTLGGLVIVKHGDGWTTVYGHASQLLVQRGQSVKRGQTVALSGDSGNADRPELHFEMRKGRTPVDPQRELPGI